MTVLAVTADEAVLAYQTSPAGSPWRWRFIEDRLDPVLQDEAGHSPQALGVRSDGNRALLREFGTGCVVEGSLRPWRQTWRACGLPEGPPAEYSPSGSRIVVPSGQGSQVLDASTGTTMSALTLPSAWGEVRDVAWSDEGHVVMASQQLDVAGEPTHELAMCTVSSGECRVVLQSSSEIVLPR